jgi:hypothetical protein
VSVAQWRVLSYHVEILDSISSTKKQSKTKQNNFDTRFFSLKISPE